jgi:hypothetical protein
MNVFELEVQKIRSASTAIASGLHIIANVGPCDLTAYDLKQSEKALRAAADLIAEIRIKRGIKERDDFQQRIKEAEARNAKHIQDF